MARWKGCVIEESLTDNRIVNGLNVIHLKITREVRPRDRWHIYHCMASDADIRRVHRYLKRGWYIHFWRGDSMVVLFKGRRFTLKFRDKKTWKPAIAYGLKLSIPRTQLDFEKEF